MPERRPIRVLSPEVANMIAAGEVVDRPASVLKELVENSLDSGATRVVMEVAAGGRKLISITDDGCGMNRDDALLSIERHATSKISDANDITRISTLGFRGEALAAVSSVSRFRLVTRSADDAAATEISMAGGKMLGVNDAGGPVGTRVEVRDLFYNIPARRKFLRSEQTELVHIRQAFIVQALAHPMTGMSLVVDGRELYNLASGAGPADRVRELFGGDYAANLRPVDLSAHGIRVHGFVGLPRMSRADRNELFFFVNSRPASVALLNFAVAEGYRTLLPQSRHPSVFLFISLDPAMVDVNVHPAKREVRFRRPDEVRDAVIAAVRSGLASGGVAAVPAPGGPQDTPMPVSAQTREMPALSIEDLPPLKAFRYPRMPMTAQDAGGFPAAVNAGQSPAAMPDTRQPVPSPQAPAQSAAPWSWCRVLGQVGGLYVLLETEDGFVVMDPHAAHERVLFEKFMAGVTGGAVESQGLLMPETVELQPEDAHRLRKNLATLKAMGFGVCEFGGDSFVVDALPACFAGVSAKTILADIALSLEQSGTRGGSKHWREEAIAQAACKAAVKARDRMSLQEIEQLVVALAGAEMPYTCPHGRPTLIFTSFDELTRKFGR